MRRVPVTADNLDEFTADLAAGAPGREAHVLYGVACHSRGLAEFWGWDHDGLDSARSEAERLSAKHGVRFTAVEMIVTARLIHYPVEAS